MSSSTRRTSRWIVSVFCVVFGLQLLRVFMATTNFYLVDDVGTHPGVAGLLALGVFGLGVLFPRVVPQRAGPATAGLALAGMRVAEQAVTTPGVDLVLSAAGVAAFLALLAFLEGGRTGAIGLLLGVTLDAGINGALGTLDFSWHTGVAPLVVVVGLAMALALASVLLGPLQSIGGRAVAVGPWLALNLVVLANPAFVASVTGLSRPAAWLCVAIGGAAAVVVASSIRTGGELAGPVLVGMVLAATLLSGPAVGLALIAGQVAGGVLLLGALGPSEGSRGAGLRVGLLLMVVLLFLYYGSYQFFFGFRSEMVLTAAALIVGWAGFRKLEAPAVGRAPSAAATGLIVPALAAWLIWTPPGFVPPPADEAVRVMTYNLHQGFGTSGRLDLAALARVIDAERPDVVALQEVARGWVVAGSVDMLGWLSDRLGMPFVSGPTADGQWGNAVLSRYPIITAENVRLPPADLALRRAYLDVTIDLGAETLRVLATHLHHVGEDQSVRVDQVQTLLAAWDGSPRTVLLGDLNAVPGSDPIRMLIDGGLVDAAFANGIRRSTAPAEQPVRTIDYILVTPDLDPSNQSVVQTEASDHLPVTVTLKVEIPGT